jgi:chemotaxis protein methyltransferase CheR
MACSTGQEAYTLAIVLKEALPKDFSVKVLATDVSNRVLKVAIDGVYQEDSINDIDKSYLDRYFTKSQELFQVNDDIRKLVTFRQFNLMNQFPFSGNFDIIFCRNVMIYFNLETQKELLRKIYDCLSSGGLLFIGQSESILNKNHNFKHLKSTIYIK